MAHTFKGRVSHIIEQDGKTLVAFDGRDVYFSAGADIAPSLKQVSELGLLIHFTYDDELRIVGVVAHNG